MPIIFQSPPNDAPWRRAFLYTAYTRSTGDPVVFGSALPLRVSTPPADLEQFVLPVHPVRRKLIRFERLDNDRNYAAMKRLIQRDRNVGAWWVFHVFNGLMVWKFIYSPEVNPDKTWLLGALVGALGEPRFNAMRDVFIQYMTASGETIEENL